MKPPFITIDGRKIGPEYPPFIVGEISCNHNGNLLTLLATITAAKKAGCDAVKIQSYEAEDMTIYHPSSDFQIDPAKWGYSTLFELYKACETPYWWHQQIFDHANENKITLFSTPFSVRAVELLEKLEAPAYKIASMELGYTDLLKAVGKTRKPVILSTGLASLEDLHQALHTVTDAAYGEEYHNGYHPEIAMLHCISEYPASAQSNTRRVSNIKRAMGAPKLVVGLSDHSMSPLPAITAVAQGACIIEKHFCLAGVDSIDKDWSLDPYAMKDFVENVQDAWKCLGTGEIDQSKSPNKQFQRSVYAIANIKDGEKLTRSNTAVIRPGYGLPASDYEMLLKKHARAVGNVFRGEPITVANCSI